MVSRHRRTVLFVSALALDALVPAFASGADLVCIDLEDAVPPDRKGESRGALLAALEDLFVPPTTQLAVRVNSLRALDGIADVQACLSEKNAIGALLLPKVETPDELRWAAGLAGDAGSGIELYSIIETPDGLENCRDIARADPRLKALFFGGFDLSTALGSAMAWEPLLYARSRVVHAAASAGIEVVDSPFPDLKDADGLRRACLQAKALGMVGKAAKDASQIQTIADVFTPTPIELERARKIVNQFRANPSKPLVFEGKLVELPTIKRLERIAGIS